MHGYDYTPLQVKQALFIMVGGAYLSLGARSRKLREKGELKTNIGNELSNLVKSTIIKQ